MKDNKEKYAITMRINKKENDIVQELKQKYSVNISQFVRNKIVELHKTLSEKIGNEL